MLTSQGDLTTCLGWQNTDAIPITLADKISEAIRDEFSDPLNGILTHKEKVDLLPSNLELASMEMSLVTAMSREIAMRSYLEQVKSHYDYILIDCMPSLGMITLNFLTASGQRDYPRAGAVSSRKGHDPAFADDFHSEKANQSFLKNR